MKVRKILKWLGIAIVCLLVGIQFIRPVRSNPKLNESQALSSHVQVTPQIASILDRSCNDCHSHSTRWPWYSNVAPVSWFVINHVNHGRSHLNFSEWAQLDKREAEEMLGEMCKEVKSGAMPMASYTRVHRNAILSSDEVKAICDWTEAERRRLQETKR